ncbi:MAG: efflux RND transporter periplasmic adaptor subunit [Rhodocyclaceae bacterium]|nr:efflux RND transporter periplasmic adaptor subunit [Rhodocyclaceae bacterium]
MTYPDLRLTLTRLLPWVFPLFLPLAANAAQDADLVPVAPAQARQLGMETMLLAEGGTATQGGLPASVVIPTGQLRLVSAPLPGLVEALLVAPGMSVKAGQSLARLASPQALELRRDLRQTSAQSELSHQALRRDELLFKEGLIPESRLQASRAAAAQSDAAATERRQALALAGGFDGASLTLRSPIEGVVLEQAASLGQRLETSAVIYKVGKLSPLWLEIQVPADIAAHAREGMAVRAEGARGRLISVGRAVASGSQMVTLRAVVTEGAERLRPGQAVTAELDLPGTTGMRLPAAALARGKGNTVVFVQTGDGSFRATTVKVGDALGDTVQVEGIKPGSRVAIKGVSGLKAIWTGVGRD